MSNYPTWILIDNNEYDISYLACDSIDENDYKTVFMTFFYLLATKGDDFYLEDDYHLICSIKSCDLTNKIMFLYLLHILDKNLLDRGIVDKNCDGIVNVENNQALYLHLFRFFKFIPDCEILLNVICDLYCIPEMKEDFYIDDGKFFSFYGNLQRIYMLQKINCAKLYKLKLAIDKIVDKLRNNGKFNKKLLGYVPPKYIDHKQVTCEEIMQFIRCYCNYRPDIDRGYFINMYQYYEDTCEQLEEKQREVFKHVYHDFMKMRAENGLISLVSNHLKLINIDNGISLENFLLLIKNNIKHDAIKIVNSHKILENKIENITCTYENKWYMYPTKFLHPFIKNNKVYILINEEVRMGFNPYTRDEIHDKYANENSYTYNDMFQSIFHINVDLDPWPHIETIEELIAENE